MVSEKVTEKREFLPPPEFPGLFFGYEKGEAKWRSTFEQTGSAISSIQSQIEKISIEIDRATNPQWYHAIPSLAVVTAATIATALAPPLAPVTVPVAGTALTSLLTGAGYYGYDVSRKIKALSAQRNSLLDQLEILSNQQVTSMWYTSIYNILPHMLTPDLETGEIAVDTFDDFLSKYPLPGASSEDIAEGERIFTSIKSSLTEGELIQDKSPDQDKIIAAMRERYAIKLDLRSVHNLTVEEIAKSFIPTQAPPEGLTFEQVSSIYREAGMPKELIASAENIREAIEDYDTYWKQVLANQSLVRAGLADARMPEMGLKEQLLLMVKSPGLVALDVFATAQRNWWAPWAATVFRARIAFGELIGLPVAMQSKPVQEFMSKFEEAKTTQNWWLAGGKAWNETEKGWANTLIYEILLDPTNLFGFGVYAKVFRAIPFAGKFLGPLATKLELGWVTGWDILLFDHIKRGVHAIAQTAMQVARRIAGEDFLNSIRAITIASGGRHYRFVPVDMVRELFIKARAYALKHPEDLGPVGLVGRALLRTMAIDEPAAKGMFTLLGTKLEVPITRDMLTSLNLMFSRIAGRSTGKEITIKEAPQHLLTILGVHETKENLKIAKTIVNDYFKNMIAEGDRLLVGKNTGQILSNIWLHTQQTVFESSQSLAAYNLEMTGQLASIFSRVKWTTMNTWRRTIDRWVVTPFAKSYLVFGAYGPGNALEGFYKPIFTSGGAINPSWKSPNIAGISYDPIARGQSKWTGILKPLDIEQAIPYIHMAPDVPIALDIEKMSANLARWRRFWEFGTLGDWFVNYWGRLGAMQRWNYWDRLATRFISEEYAERAAKAVTGAPGADVDVMKELATKASNFAKQLPPEHISVMHTSTKYLETILLDKAFAGPEALAKAIDDIVKDSIAKAQKAGVKPLRPEVAGIYFGDNIPSATRAIATGWLRTLPDRAKLLIAQIEVNAAEVAKVGPKATAAYFPQSRRMVFKSIDALESKEIFFHELGHDIFEDLSKDELAAFRQIYPKVPKLLTGALYKPATGERLTIHEAFADAFAYHSVLEKELAKEAPEVASFFKQYFPVSKAAPTKVAAKISADEALSNHISSNLVDEAFANYPNLHQGIGVDAARRAADGRLWAEAGKGIDDFIESRRIALYDVLLHSPEVYESRFSQLADTLLSYQPANKAEFQEKLKMLSDIVEFYSSSVDASIQGAQEAVDELIKYADNYESLLAKDKYFDEVKQGLKKYMSTANEGFERAVKGLRANIEGTQPSVIDWTTVKTSGLGQYESQIKGMIDAMPLDIKLNIKTVRFDARLKTRLGNWNSRTKTISLRSPDTIDILYHEIGHSISEELTSGGDYSILKRYAGENRANSMIDQLNRIKRKELRPELDLRGVPDTDILYNYVSGFKEAEESFAGSFSNWVKGKGSGTWGNFFDVNFPKRFKGVDFLPDQRDSILQLFDSWTEQLRIYEATRTKQFAEEAKLLAKAPPGKLRNDAFWQNFRRVQREVWTDGKIAILESKQRSLIQQTTVSNILDIAGPPPPIINASGRQLTRLDVASIFQSHPQSLARATLHLDTMLLKGKDQFIMEVRAQAEIMARQAGATADQMGFTKNSIASIYDQLLGDMMIDPAIASVLEPALMELKAFQNELWSIYNTKGLPRGFVEDMNRRLASLVDEMATIPGYMKPLAKAAPVMPDIATFLARIQYSGGADILRPQVESILKELPLDVVASVRKVRAVKGKIKEGILGGQATTEGFLDFNVQMPRETLERTLYETISHEANHIYILDLVESGNYAQLLRVGKAYGYDFSFFGDVAKMSSERQTSFILRYRDEMEFIADHPDKLAELLRVAPAVPPTAHPINWEYSLIPIPEEMRNRIQSLIDKLPKGTGIDVKRISLDPTIPKGDGVYFKDSGMLSISAKGIRNFEDLIYHELGHGFPKDIENNLIGEISKLSKGRFNNQDLANAFSKYMRNTLSEDSPAFTVLNRRFPKVTPTTPVKPKITPFKWSEKWQREQILDDIKMFLKTRPAGEDLWFHGGASLAGEKAVERGWVTKDLDDAIEYAFKGEGGVYVVSGKQGLQLKGTYEAIIKEPKRIVKSFSVKRRYKYPVAEAAMPPAAPPAEAAIPPKAPPAPPPIRQLSDDFLAAKQRAADKASWEYSKDWADHTNPTALTATMRAVYPFWTYESHRLFWVPRTMIRFPQVFKAWGTYMSNTEDGYIPIPGTSLQFNPLRGSIFMGGGIRLIRKDYPEYYDLVPGLSETFDYASRIGYYPAAYLNFLKSFGVRSAGGRPQWGELLPAVPKTALNLYLALHGDSKPAQALMNIIFPDIQREFIITIFASKIAHEMGLDYSGRHIWDKVKEGIELTPEEKEVWGRATKLSGWYGLPMEHAGILRVRADLMVEAWEESGKLIEEVTGLTQEQQLWIRRHGYRIADYAPEIRDPLIQDLIQQMDSVKYWSGTFEALMPSSWQAEDRKRALFWSSIRDLDDSRKSDYEENDRRVRAGEISFRQWRNQNSRIANEFATSFNAVANSEEYINVPIGLFDELDKEGNVIRKGLVTVMQERPGYLPPVLHPAEEILNTYYSIQLDEAYDPVNDIWYTDWDSYFWKIDNIVDAVGKDRRPDLVQMLTKNMTALRRLYWQVSREYFRPYNRVQTVQLELYDDEQKAHIRKFLTTTSDVERDEIREIINYKTNDKLVSGYQTDVRQARENMRLISPELDAWLLFFQITQKTLSDSAQRLYTEYRSQTGIKP